MRAMLPSSSLPSRSKTAWRPSSLLSAAASLQLSRNAAPRARRLLRTMMSSWKLFSVQTLLIIVWLYTVYWAERSIFRTSIESCRWDKWEKWVGSMHHGESLFFVVLSL